MAIPVLATVAVAGVAWLAISKQRATLTPGKTATPDTTPVVREHGDAPAGDAIMALGANVTGHPEGGGSIDDNQGADPTTTPSSGGFDGNMAPRPTTPVDVAPQAPVAFAFGAYSVNGITKYQESRAIQENGPAMGMVW